MTEESTPMLSLDDYADAHNVATRTVRRWLEAGQVPGATKLAGRWAIPAAAIRQIPQGQVVTTQPKPPAAPTVDTVLDTMAVFVPLETAGQLLGVSVYAIRTHPDYFRLERFGDNGAWVMPKFRIRELNG